MLKNSESVIIKQNILNFQRQFLQEDSKCPSKWALFVAVWTFGSSRHLFHDWISRNKNLLRHCPILNIYTWYFLADFTESVSWIFDACHFELNLCSITVGGMWSCWWWIPVMPASPQGARNNFLSLHYPLLQQQGCILLTNTKIKYKFNQIKVVINPNKKNLE